MSALMTLQDRSMEFSFNHSWIRLSRRLRRLKLEEFLRLPTRFPCRFRRSFQRHRFKRLAVRSRQFLVMGDPNDPEVVPGSGWPWVFRRCW